MLRPGLPADPPPPLRARLALALVLAGCAHVPPDDGPARTSASHPARSIRLLDTAGRPLAALPVVVTRLPADKTRLVSDAAGRVPLPPGDGPWAIAAATRDQYVFVERLSPGVDVVRATRDCVHLRGHTAGAPGGAVIALRRYSPLAGDEFDVRTDAQGRFSVCVPRAQYGTEFVGAIAANPRTLDARGGDLDVGALEGWPLATLRDSPVGLEAALTAQGATWRGDAADRIAQAVAGAALVGVGEANHGTAEYMEERSQILDVLIARAHTRLVLLEASVGQTPTLDAALAGSEDDVARAQPRLRWWMWDTHDARRAFLRIRAYNLTVPAAQRVHVAGIDPVGSELAWQQLHEAAQRAGDPQLSADVAVVAGFASDRFFRTVATLPAERVAALDAACRSLTTRIPTLTTLPAADRDQALDNAILIGQSLQLALHQGPVESFELRDRFMAENAVRIAARYPGGPAVLWAHDGHVSRGPLWSMRTMGMHLAEALGPRYRAIGLLGGRGTFQAWDRANAIGLFAQTLPEPVDTFVEHVMLRAFSAPTYLVVDTLREPARGWLARPHHVRQFGADWPGDEDGREVRRLAADFDIIGFVPETHSATPTPTGVRRAK